MTADLRNGRSIASGVGVEEGSGVWRMFKLPPPISVKISPEQECIPVGCVPPTAVAVRGGAPPGIPGIRHTPLEQAPPPGSRHTPPLWTDTHL